MQGTGDRLQVAFRVLLAQHVAVVGVDEHIQFTTCILKHKLRATVGGHRWQVLADLALGVSLVHLLQQAVGALCVVPGLDHHQVAVEQRIKLRFEQVDDPGDRQQDHERGDEQPGIKVPTPGQVVKTNRRFAHGVLPCCAEKARSLIAPR
ncbi:hypothetical protein D3C80_1154960 [compost metagenome]